MNCGFYFVLCRSNVAANLDSRHLRQLYDVAFALSPENCHLQPTNSVQLPQASPLEIGIALCALYAPRRSDAHSYLSSAVRHRTRWVSDPSTTQLQHLSLNHMREF
jgi:hypothetical protein